MKILPKPLTLVPRPGLQMSAFAVLVMKPVPKERAYQQLVTSQNVHPDRAKTLLKVP